MLDFKNCMGMTPLHYACKLGNTKMVEALLDLNADINVVNNEGESPLHDSIYSGNLK